MFRLGGKIEFRLVENLQQVVHRLDLTPRLPDGLCAVTSSPSQLLYYDSHAGRVCQVDCSTAPCRFMQKEIPIEYDGQERVWSMCTSGDLLVVTRYQKGVFAFSLRGGQCKWRVSGKLPGMQQEMNAVRVAADEQGHLFINDGNNKCVHVLSARNGAHLGLMVRKGELGIGTPKEVTWHRQSASLVVAHEKNGVYHLSVFFRQD